MEIVTKDRTFHFEDKTYTLPEVLIFSNGKVFDAKAYYFYEATDFKKPRKGDFFINSVTLVNGIASQANTNLKDRRIIVEKRARAISDILRHALHRHIRWLVSKESERR